MTNGLYFRLAYTYAHAIDDGAGCSGRGRASDGAKLLRAQFRARQQRNRSATAFCFLMDWRAESFWRGAPFLSTLFDDWKYSGVITIGSGRPLNVSVSGDPNQDMNGTNNRIPSASRNSFLGPDYATAHMPLARSFYWAIDLKLESLAEAFNALNRDNQRVNITEGGLETTSTSFVKTFTQLGLNYYPGHYQVPSNPIQATNAFAPREIQFGVKLAVLIFRERGDAGQSRREGCCMASLRTLGYRPHAETDGGDRPQRAAGSPGVVPVVSRLKQISPAEWQTELAGIPAPPFGEAERGRWLMERFRELKLEDVHTDEVGNVLGTRRSAKAAKIVKTSARNHVALSAHIDTVFPAGTPLNICRQGQKLHGPGILYNAASVIALLAIAGALRKTRFLTLPHSFYWQCRRGGRRRLARYAAHFFQSSCAASICYSLVVDGAGCQTIVAEALGQPPL